ncbi:MAG: hypothetical protein IPO81_00145 [Kouleothrix sp.]|nr:hypothetical protein [Kouleothrix sp.]
MQHIIRRLGRCQLLAKLRDDRIRLTALPVEQAICATLQPLAQRLEEYGDDACRHE